MATIIKSDGTTYKYEPLNKSFITISEISKIINGLVEPLFAGEFWFFVCKNAKRLKREKNKQVSELLNIEIFGDVVVALDVELSPSFFVPKDFLDEKIKKLGKDIDNESFNNIEKYLIDEENEDYGDEDYGDEYEDNEIKSSKKDKEDKTGQAEIDQIMIMSYENLFEKGKSFTEIIKNFELYNDGEHIIDVHPNKDERIKFIENMLEYFLKLEEYEKCSKINKFKDELINFYKDF